MSNVLCKLLKYEIRSYGGTFLDLPVGTKFLHAGEQDGKLFVWLKVPQEDPYAERKGFIFEIKYTGEYAPRIQYAKTFFSQNNTVVNHLFVSKGLLDDTP